MKIRQKGNLFEIIYRCKGYKNIFTERFDTIEAAKFRVAQIEYEKSNDTFRPPLKLGPGCALQKSQMTVSELMDSYVDIYGLNHWGENFLSCSKHRIEHYIKPYIGDVLVKDLTTRDIDKYYDLLQSKPAVVLKGHKVKNKTVSPDVIEKVHGLLRSAFNQAVRWGYVEINVVASAKPPKHKSKKREVWSSDTSKKALEICDDPILLPVMLLAIGCTTRIGEILGLTWDCVKASEEDVLNGTATVHINKELKRCNKDSLKELEAKGRSDVIFTFPESKQTGCKTALVLKPPKTESSIRTVYFDKTVAEALQKVKEEQEQYKALLGPEYEDYGLVIAQANGKPVEGRFIAKRFKDFIKKNDLPPVVFHSLRHFSTSIKLTIGNGNIKAVQGDTGHSKSDMVTDVYAHIQDEDRRDLAKRVERDFFCSNSEKASPEIPESSDDIAKISKLLQSNPAMIKHLLGMLESSQKDTS